TEINEPTHCFLALDAEPIDVAKHTPDEGTNKPIAWIGPVGNAPVDQNRPDVASPTLAQKVRPDLRFDHDEQPRLHHVEGPSPRERPIKWEVKHGIDVRNASARQLLPRESRR